MLSSAGPAISGPLWPPAEVDGPLVHEPDNFPLAGGSGTGAYFWLAGDGAAGDVALLRLGTETAPMDPNNPFRGSPRFVQPRPAEPKDRPLLDEMVVEHLRGQLLAAFREGDADHAAKTEEAANIARLAEAYAAIGRADWDAFAQLLSDDVEMAILGAPGTPFVGHWRGRDKVVTATQYNFSLVSDQRPRILWVTGQGNQVMVGAVETGIFRSTGKRYEVHWMQVFRFRHGQVFYFREFCDSASLIEAAR